MTCKKAVLLTGISFVLHHQQLKLAKEHSEREDLNDGCPTPYQFRDDNAIHRQGKRRKRK